MENKIIGNGRYKVLKEINRGGTAVVYSGIDLTQQKKVALKVMSAKHRKEGNLKAVKREIDYAMSVRCRHVVQLLDFVSDEEHVVIVWELIEGSDLLDLLNDKGGRLNERDAAFYFCQLHQAISFIHSNGLVHRDLKPENCMVEAATNRIKLIDFGLSKHDLSAVTLGIGTPDYMSPELLGMDASDDFVALKQRREGKYDAKACDVWALGVLLYLLVTGKYAFEDPKRPDNVIATLQNIRRGKMRALPSRISPECGDLIRQMLQHDPKKRITLADMASHPWFRLCNVDSFGSMEDESPRGVSSPAGEHGVAQTQSFSFPQMAHSKHTPKTIEVEATMQSSTITSGGRAAVGATTPPGQPLTTRNESGDTIIKVTKVASADDDDGAAGKSKGWFCKLLFCSQEKGQRV